MKKIDLVEISFNVDDDDNNVIVRATDQAGWSVSISMGEDGLATKVVKEEAHEDHG